MHCVDVSKAKFSWVQFADRSLLVLSLRTVFITYVDFTYQIYLNITTAFAINYFAFAIKRKLCHSLMAGTVLHLNLGHLPAAIVFTVPKVIAVFMSSTFLLSIAHICFYL